MTRGRLYVLEGPDNVGKSSVAAGVADALRARGFRVASSSFPGTSNGSLGRMVYMLHHDPSSLGVVQVSDLALQTLHVAAHVDSVERSLVPALEDNDVVLLDRFWWSTLIYGQAAGVPEASLTKLIAFEKTAWKSIVPACLFLLERPGVQDEALAMRYAELARSDVSAFPVHQISNSSKLTDAIRAVVERITAMDRGSRTSPSIRPAKTTVVYDSFWSFAAERQRIFYRRAAGERPPWTEDETLAQFKFTNVFRATDRVSQYLIREVIYNEPWGVEDLFFRIVLFKLFNRIETWELFRNTFGEPTASGFAVDAYDEILEEAMSRRRKIYSAAYIMASGATKFNVKRKHSAHLRILAQMLQDEAPKKVHSARSLAAVYELLLAYPTLGPFLAFQYTIDLNYSPIIDFDEDDFVVAGPGALDGISKCFASTAGLAPEEVIRLVTERQELEFGSRSLEFGGLWGRPMKLIDVQNVFCEIAKYARAVHPEFPGRSGRTRIKQRFAANSSPVRYMLPPKWGLNERVEQWAARAEGFQESSELFLPFDGASKGKSDGK